MTTRPRVFVTQPIAQRALERLRGIADVTINKDTSKILARGKLLAAVKKCDILFSLLHDTVDRAVLAANPRLKAVAAMNITPDRIAVAEATKRGIAVTVIPPIVAESVADLHLGLMIAVARRMIEGDRSVRASRFPGSQSNHFAGSYVFGKTLGLIGAGRIGQATARRAKGFSMKILYWGPRRKPEAEQELGMEYVTLDRLYAEADFVSLHQPYNAETHHMISDREFALMKPTAYIVNTARGAVIDEAAMVRALKKKRIAGAGLDVFENEPKVPAALLKMKNVVLTPHLGSAVMELREAMANVVIDNIQALIEGRTPPNCVNPQVLNK
ncbi:MAG: D-glycerate dehydrogenase [Rhizobiales bacterium]|nr:D-glycerate dehydrogenase [Hyphomicrobiales bacterium]